MDLKVYALLNAKIKELTGESIDLSKYYTKEEADAAITAKVAEIVADAPEDFDTLKEMSDWISQHEDSAAAMNSAIQQNATDISTLNTNKVDKVEGKSLISDSEITRLASVNNYDDTTIKQRVTTNETNISNANTQIADIYNRCGGGKNLIDFKNLRYVSSGGTVVTRGDDNSITITSNRDWASSSYGLTQLEVGKTYRISFEITNYSFAGGKVCIRLSETPGGQAPIRDIVITGDGEYSDTFTVTDNNVYKYILLYPNCSATTYVNSFTVSKLMLQFDDIQDKSFVPYIPTNSELYSMYETVATDITSCKSNLAINKTALGTQCKNLLKNTAKSQTLSGITYTVNDDKSITVNGTATGRSTIVIGSITKAGKYIVTGCPSGGSGSSYMISLTFNNSDGTYSYNHEGGKGLTFAMDASIHKAISVRIQIEKGVTMSNATWYPMVRYSDVTDDTYEPYSPSLQEQINTISSRLEALEAAATSTTSETE